jgi:hypothetical protein
MVRNEMLNLKKKINKKIWNVELVLLLSINKKAANDVTKNFMESLNST